MLAPLSLKRAAMALGETGTDMVAGTCRRIVGAETTPLYKHFAALPTLQPLLFTLQAPLNWCEVSGRKATGSSNPKWFSPARFGNARAAISSTGSERHK